MTGGLGSVPKRWVVTAALLLSCWLHKVAAANSSPYNYAEALHKSLLYYQVQRSGELPYQRLAWRANSCSKCTGSMGEDLSGGYWEAGEMGELLEAIKWGTDFIMASMPTANQYVALYGNATADFLYYGPPEDYEMYAPDGASRPIFSWDVKTPGYNVLLASLQPSNMQAVSAANAFFQAYIPGSQRTVPHTANGLAYPWKGAGSLRTASNTAMLGFVHARTLKAAGNTDLADQIISYSLSQLNFVLGDGGRSWLVGFGSNPPQQSFQKTAWNSVLTWSTKGQSVDVQRADFQDTNAANRFIAYGALVGGPFDQSGVTYQDRRLNYTFVEPAVDYSSGLVGAIAAAAEYYGGQDRSRLGLRETATISAATPPQPPSPPLRPKSSQPLPCLHRLCRQHLPLSLAEGISWKPMR
ncbi:hypothetical protein WJX84_000284 [Apatococcus fuscideae]|uniref:cellulase n=1 Tax=Apatococcus fuscideae TaxID=2026836 RepID=A0AAW1SMV7_9CHLO